MIFLGFENIKYLKVTKSQKCAGLQSFGHLGGLKSYFIYVLGCATTVVYRLAHNGTMLDFTKNVIL